METKTYIKTAGKIINQAKDIASEYYRLTGRPLGITGEVAEYEAIKILGLEVCNVREKGCDAIKTVNGKKYRVQIKGRVIHEDSKASQRVGSLKKTEDWDLVLLILLSSNFEVLAIHEAKRSSVIKALDIPGSKARNIRGQLSVNNFKSISRKVWPT